MNDITIDQINNFNPDLIYFSVGCAANIGGHKPSNPNFCQQYPLFLYDKHFNNKKKVIILFDPLLENPLIIQKIIPDLQIIDSNKELRILMNKTILVLAYKLNYFYRKIDSQWSLSQAPDSQLNQNPGKLDKYMQKLIDYVLSHDKKMIVQDYTGQDIKKYMNIFSMDKPLFSKKIIFDITNNDGGCLIDFSKYHLYFETNGDFKDITKLKPSELKKINPIPELYMIRINKLFEYIRGPISRYLNVLRGKNLIEKYTNANFNNAIDYIKVMFPEITNEKTEDNIIQVIKTILFEIFDCLEIDRKCIEPIVLSNYESNSIYDLWISLQRS